MEKLNKKEKEIIKKWVGVVIDRFGYDLEDCFYFVRREFFWSKEEIRRAIEKLTKLGNEQK